MKKVLKEEIGKWMFFMKEEASKRKETKMR